MHESRLSVLSGSQGSFLLLVTRQAPTGYRPCLPVTGMVTDAFYSSHFSGRLCFFCSWYMDKLFLMSLGICSDERQLGVCTFLVVVHSLWWFAGDTCLIHSTLQYKYFCPFQFQTTIRLSVGLGRGTHIGCRSWSWSWSRSWHLT